MSKAYNGRHFHSKIKRFTERVNAETVEQFKSDIRGYLKSLSDNILAFSPSTVNPRPSEYSGNNFVQQTCIYVGRNKPQWDGAEFVTDDGYRVTHSRGIPDEIYGLTPVLNACKDLRTMPSVITIENSTKSDRDFPYWVLIEDYGWSTKSPPYSPFSKALQKSNAQYSHLIQEIKA